MLDRWNLFREIDALHRELDRVFEGVWPRERSLHRSNFLPGLSARSYPMVNVFEDPEAVYVEALAPGLDTDSLEVTVKSNTLTVAGEKVPLREVKPEQLHRNERASGRFMRSIHLNTEVNEAEVSARYEDGILTVVMPRSEKAKPKQIEVHVG